jgi:hypothetical protein
MTEERNAKKIYFECLNRKDHLEELTGDGKILKWTLEK